MDSYHHGDLRTAVIDCAMAMLATDGVEKLSLRKIARELGVSHQAPYKHFADRAMLVSSIRTEGFRELTEVTRAAARKHPRSRKRQLAAAAQSYVENALRSPALYQLMFASPVDSSDQDGVAAARVSFDALVQIIDDRQSVNDSKNAEPSQTTINRARLFWASMHGIASLTINQYFGGKSSEAKDLAKKMCEELAADWFE